MKPRDPFQEYIDAQKPAPINVADVSSQEDEWVYCLRTLSYQNLRTGEIRDRLHMVDPRAR